MLIKPLRELKHEGRKYSPFEVMDVLDYHGQEFIRMGLAAEVKEAAADGAAHPTISAPATSPTGEVRPASLSPAAPARKNRKFRRMLKQKLSQ